MSMYIGDLVNDDQVQIRKAVEAAKIAENKYWKKTLELAESAARKVKARCRPGYMKMKEKVKDIQNACPHQLKREVDISGHHRETMVECSVCGKENV